MLFSCYIHCHGWRYKSSGISICMQQFSYGMTRFSLLHPYTTRVFGVHVALITYFIFRLMLLYFCATTRFLAALLGSRGVFIHKRRALSSSGVYCPSHESSVIMVSPPGILCIIPSSSLSSIFQN